MHAIQFASGQRQVARGFRTARQNDCIKFFQQFGRADDLFGIIGHAFARRLLAHENTGAELHTLGLQLRQTPVDQPFVQFEIGYAVTQQSADAAIFFKHHHIVPNARQLLRSRKPCGARADHSYLLAGLV